MARLFISYRRNDCPDTVKLIYEKLRKRLSSWHIFYDHQSIELGDAFPEQLAAEIEEANVVLVVIGPRWLEELHERKDAPIDHVRQEIQKAIETGAHIIPVLTRDLKTMPTEEDLAEFPKKLHLISRRNGKRVRSDPYFDHDLEMLADALERKFPTTLLSIYKKHPGTVKATGIVFITLILAIAGIAYFYFNALHQADRARDQTAQKVAALREAEASRKLADDRAKRERAAKEEAARNAAIAEEKAAEAVRERETANSLTLRVQEERYADQFKKAWEQFRDSSYYSAVTTLYETQPQRRHWEYNFTLRKLRSANTPIYGHANGAKSITVHPETRQVLTAGYYVVAEWTYADAGLKPEILSDDVQASQVVYSPNGERYAVAKGENLEIWGVNERKLLGTFKNPKAGITAVEFTTDSKMVITGDLQGILRFWKLDETAPVKEFSCRNGAVGSLAVSPNGKLLAVGRHDLSRPAPNTPAVFIWKMDDAKSPEMALGDIQRAGANSLEFDSSSDRLLIAGSTGNVALWDMKTGKPIVQYTGHKGAVHRAVFNADETQIASGGADCMLHVWNSKTGESIRRLEGCIWSIDDIAYLDASTILTAGYWEPLRLWKLEEQPDRQPLRLPGANHVQQVAFSPDPAKVAAFMNEGTIKIWDTVKGTLVASTPSVGIPVSTATCVAISNDCNRLVTGNQYGDVTVYNVAGKKIERANDLTDRSHGKAIVAIDIDSDGKRAISADSDRWIRIWQCDNLRTVHKRRLDEVPAAVFLLSDKSSYVTLGKNGRLEMWAFEGDHVSLQRTFFGQIYNAVISSSKRFLIGFKGQAASGAMAVLWDLETDLQPVVLETGSKMLDTLRAATISKDGDRVFGLVGSYREPGDAKVICWSAMTGTPLLIESVPGDYTRLAYDSKRQSVLLANAPVAKERFQYGFSRAADQIQVEKVNAGVQTKVLKLNGSPPDDHVTLQANDFGLGGIHTLAANPNSDIAITGGTYDCKVWNFVDFRKPVRREPVNTHTVNVTFNRKGDLYGRLAETTLDTLVVWEYPDRKLLLSESELRFTIKDFCFHLHEREVAILYRDRVVLREIGGKKQRKELELPEGAKVTAIWYASDGRQLLGAGSDGKLYLWNLETGELSQQTPPATLSAVSPADTLVAGLHPSGDILLWDFALQKQSRMITADSVTFSGFRFSHDGKLLAGLGRDNAIRIYNTTTGELQQVCSGHAGKVEAFDFGHNNSKLLSGDYMGRMKIWNLNTTR